MRCGTVCSECYCSRQIFACEVRPSKASSSVSRPGTPLRPCDSPNHNDLSYNFGADASPIPEQSWRPPSRPLSGSVYRAPWDDQPHKNLKQQACPLKVFADSLLLHHQRSRTVSLIFDAVHSVSRAFSGSRRGGTVAKKSKEVKQHSRQLSLAANGNICSIA